MYFPCEREFTPREIEYLRAYAQTGDFVEAAKRLGSISSFVRSLVRELSPWMAQLVEPSIRHYTQLMSTSGRLELVRAYLAKIDENTMRDPAFN